MADFQRFDYCGPEGVAYHERRKTHPDVESWLAKIRAEKIQPLIKQTDSVFEYGVGFGWNLMALDCARKVGFDVVPGLRNIVESRQIIFVDDLRLVPDRAFDVIICHHTLEHLKQPGEALSTMLRLLKADGHLLLFVPYEIERKYRNYNASDKSHHLYSWTPLSLSNLVIAVGFQVQSVSLRKFRFDRIAGVVARRLCLGEKAYRMIRNLGLLLLPEYEVALVALNAHRT